MRPGNRYNRVMCACGLLIRPTVPYREAAQEIPLTGVAVRAKVTASASLVKVSQQYRNDEQTPIEADLLSPIRTVESPSHRISTEIDGSTVRVSLAGDEGRMDRDFVLVLAAAQPARPVGRIVHDCEGDRYVMASFRPAIDTQRIPVDVTFMVDCSGSMHGSSIEDARRTLRLCLRSMQEGDYFNIIRFGSTYQSKFRKPMPYDNPGHFERRPRPSLESGRRRVLDAKQGTGRTHRQRF